MIPLSQSCPGPVPAAPLPAGSGVRRSAAPRRRGSRLAARSVSSSRALAMLTLLPIQAAPVQRVHVEGRQPDGTLRVHDRPTGQQLLVYTPRFNEQFRAGHRAGRWYVRPLLHVGVQPQSCGFATARAAIEAVSAGSWTLDAAAAARRGPGMFRVIWPAREGDAPQPEQRQSHLTTGKPLSSEARP